MLSWLNKVYQNRSEQLLRGGSTSSPEEVSARFRLRNAVRDAVTESGGRGAGDAGEWAHIILAGHRAATGSLLASVTGRAIPPEYPAALHTLHGSKEFCDSAEKVLGDLPVFRSDGDWHDIRTPLSSPLKSGLNPDSYGLGKTARAVCIVEDARGVKFPRAIPIAVESSALGYGTPAVVIITDDPDGVIEQVSLAGMEGRTAPIAPPLAAVTALPRG